MADIDFPASLPAPNAGQMTENALETKVQDQGEVGSPRQRNRFTRGLARFAFSTQLTGTQKDLLLAFYDTTLVRGVLRFNWTHPTTAVVYEAIMPKRPPIKHVSVDIWTADIEVEEI